MIERLNVVRKLSKIQERLYLAAFTYFTFVFEGLITDRAFAFIGFLSFDGRKKRKIARTQIYWPLSIMTLMLR